MITKRDLISRSSCFCEKYSCVPFKRYIISNNTYTSRMLYRETSVDCSRHGKWVVNIIWLNIVQYFDFSRSQLCINCLINM